MRPVPMTTGTPWPFHQFPVVPNGKIPAIGGWQQRATNDPAKLEAMFKGKNFNVGVSTADLLVLDVDTKSGKKGLDSLTALDLEHGIPRTYVVRTPTGGEHHYFKPKAPVACSAGKLGDGLDVRGEGGYVVGAGSVIDGKAYEVIDDSPVADAPDWLEQLAGQPKQRTTGQVVAILDAKPARDRAQAYLETAQPAVEGLGGDAHTFKVAARVKDLGVSELAALDLMSQFWNPRCSPPWDYEALATKVSNAYHYGKEPIGSATAEADFDKIDPLEIPIEKPKRAKLYRRKFADIKPRLTDSYLIQKLLGEEAMSVLYGESHVGKTFFAMALAYAIAAGQPFGKRKVTKGAVLYVAAEAGLSAENRVAALRKRYGGENVPFDLVPCPVDLLRPGGDTQALIDLVKEAEAEHGKVRLIVIDTLSRAIAGGNENSPDDMGALVKHLDALRVATKAHVMVVHHSGKDTAKGARGHSLLRAATDTEIEIQAGAARITKQRDMEMGEAIGFDLPVIELGTSADGESVTSCVAVPINQEEMDFGGDPDRETLMLAALRAAMDANKGRPVPVEAWAAVCRRYINEGVPSGNGERQKGAFSDVMAPSLATALMRERNRLQQKNAVLKNKRGQWLIA